VGVASSALKQPIFMEMKLSQFSLGRHPLSDAPYWNPDMVIREQGSGRHRLSGAPYWNPNMVTSERGPIRRLRRWRIQALNCGTREKNGVEMV
jgi:hypothetical protein